MRITGRQLRQIIKEEVENMMSEVEGNPADLVKKFTTTFQSGEQPGGRVKTQLLGKAGTDSRGVMVRQNTIFQRIGSAFNNIIPIDEPCKVNMVVDVAENGLITQITDIAINGVKPTSGLPLVIRGGTPPAKAVTADIMSEITWAWPVADPLQDGVVIKSVKFRA
jgi:hypothetical protein